MFKDYSYDRFIFSSDLSKEHFPLKAPLLITQMEKQYHMISNSDRRGFEEEKQHDYKLRLLMEFTNGPTQAHLKIP